MFMFACETVDKWVVRTVHAAVHCSVLLVDVHAVQYENGMLRGTVKRMEPDYAENVWF